MEYFNQVSRNEPKFTEQFLFSFSKTLFLNVASKADICTTKLLSLKWLLFKVYFSALKKVTVRLGSLVLGTEQIQQTFRRVVCWLKRGVMRHLMRPKVFHLAASEGQNALQAPCLMGQSCEEALNTPRHAKWHWMPMFRQLNPIFKASAASRTQPGTFCLWLQTLNVLWLQNGTGRS